jgi:hypothetical protein
MADMRMGAQLLRTVLHFDALMRSQKSRTEAANLLMRKHGVDRKVVDALIEVEPEIKQSDVLTCSIEQLALGMIFDQDVRAHDGMLVVARGQEVTAPLLTKLRNFDARGAIDVGIRVTIPKPVASVPSSTLAAGA